VRLGLLHTSPVHVATFDALAAEETPGVELVHLVREDLLADAREHGPEAVADPVAEAVRGLSTDAVLCTCSTIGAVAERVDAGVPVLRLDRPMAAEAVSAGGQILVLAALESTLAPTRELLAEEAARAGTTPGVEARIVAGAWERFEAGDTEGYLDLVRAAVEQVTDEAAVVVLAQASMAPAADAAGAGVRVLTSPPLGLRAAVDAVSPGRLTRQRTRGGTRSGSPGTAPPPRAG
jgi:hypothetical protein